MRKRLFALLALVALLCLALPSIALAHHLDKLTIKGIGSSYSVAVGKNLTLTGRLRGEPETKHWDLHVPMRIQRLVKGRWVDMQIIRPKGNGYFTFTLVKPSRGTYRALYPQCEHYYSRAAKFYVGSKNPYVPKPVVKLDPQLSVNDVGMGGPLRNSVQPAALQTVTVYPIWLGASVHTTAPVEAMSGTHLTMSVYGSLDGGSTYSLLYTTPTAGSFGGAPMVLVGPYVVPANTDQGDWYDHYYLKADWSGNEFTNAGSASSAPFVAPS
jgi:hypothetical protein